MLHETVGRQQRIPRTNIAFRNTQCLHRRLRILGGWDTWGILLGVFRRHDTLSRLCQWVPSAPTSDPEMPCNLFK